MILVYSALPSTLLGPPDDGYNGHVPVRALYMAPDAAQSLLQADAAAGGIIFTDILRSAAASLQALREHLAGKKAMGVKPPGFSGHGYGLSFDVDVSRTLRRAGISYVELREFLEDFGFFCHRRDLDSAGSEAQHFNFLTDGRIKIADPTDHVTWAAPLEAEIQARYGPQMTMDRDAIATSLVKCGVTAPLYEDAVRQFQSAWALQADGVPGPITQRVLAFVAAETQIDPLPQSVP